MAFFETPALLCARGEEHQPGPTMPPFHVYSPFPTSDPRSYPIHEVFQFEYLGLILDPKLRSRRAATTPLGVQQQLLCQYCHRQCVSLTCVRFREDKESTCD